MKNTKIHLILLALSLLMSGCAAFNDTRFANSLGTQKNVILISYAIAERLEKQAYPPLMARHPGQPILTTTFVNTNNLSETSNLSRILQENMASRFVQMGYTVRETKLRNELNIEEGSGEMILSRNLNHLDNKQTAQAIVLGTYSITDRVMYINAKLVNPENSNIISATDYKIQMDQNMLAMFGMQLQSETGMNMIKEPKPSLVTRILY